MSKISERIRAAALGPTPIRFPSSLWKWIGLGVAWDVVYDFLDDGLATWQRSSLVSDSDDTRRTLLLFVAEAIE